MQVHQRCTKEFKLVAVRQFGSSAARRGGQVRSRPCPRTRCWSQPTLQVENEITDKGPEAGFRGLGLTMLPRTKRLKGL